MTTILNAVWHIMEFSALMLCWLAVMAGAVACNRLYLRFTSGRRQRRR